MSPSKNVIAVTPGGDITMDQIVGWYAVSSIPDAGVSSAKLRRAWTMAGLNPTLIPKTRKAVHAFQVAARSVETRRQAIREDGNGTDDLKTNEVRVEKVLENADECVYQVTLLVRDEAQRLIEHPKAMRVVFTKATEEITGDPLDKTSYDQVKHLEQAIRDHYEVNASKVPGAKVRAAIRDELQDVNATTIAKKLYFIPKGPGREVIENLTTVLSEMYDSDAEFHTIPVASSKEQKETIAKHFGINVEEESKRLLSEISERLRSGDTTIRKDRLRAMLDQRRNLIKSVEKYKDILDMSLGKVDATVELLNDGLEELIVKTDSSGKASG